MYKYYLMFSSVSEYNQLFDRRFPQHTAPDCASSGGPFFIGSLFVIMMYLRGYLVISEAT